MSVRPIPYGLACSSTHCTNTRLLAITTPTWTRPLSCHDQRRRYYAGPVPVALRTLLGHLGIFLKPSAASSWELLESSCA
eukprot:1997583-Pyramimonas_sp.AAC.1